MVRNVVEVEETLEHDGLDLGLRVALAWAFARILGQVHPGCKGGVLTLQ